MHFLTLTRGEILASCKREGRISDTSDGILMDWSACGFSVNVRANGAVLDFAPYHADQPVYIAVTADGVKQIHALSDGVTRVVVPLAYGAHTVTVQRLSEGSSPLYCRSLRLSAPFGEEVPALLPPPAKRSRRIVFFGDSITCGYGNAAEETSPYLTSEQDPTAAYAWKCAELMGADAELVSISGQGIVRNCNGVVDTPIPTFFSWQSRHLRTPHAFDGKVDYVVVNAGTNDNGGGVTDEEFHDGAKAFLLDLRAHYPQARIVWYYGLMGARYDGVLRALEAELSDTDASFAYLPTRTISREKGEIGAVWHPSVEGDDRGAAELAAYLYSLS